MQISQSHLLIDTCCMLNLCASGQLLNILQVIPAQAAIAQEVKQELLKIENVIHFESVIAQGLLVAVDFESESEEEAFVNYAANLDDGEAATGAIAINRGWAIATDEKKATNFFSQESRSLKIISTPEIIKYWSEAAKIEQLTLNYVLREIQIKGRYMPSKNHSLKNWWQTAIDNHNNQ
jgi:predicted nucleic acid-binding protein